MKVNKKVVHAQYNLDFAGLQRRLHTVQQSSGLKRAQSTQCMFGETRTFAEILDQEVEKVVLFYIREQGSIAKHAWEARSSQLSQLQDCSISLQRVDELLERFRDLGEQILDLLEYLEDNVSRLRTIIQKHDACFDQKLGSVYFDTHLGKASKSAHLLPLYHQDGIRAILNTVRRGFEEIYEARNTLQGGNETLFLSNSVLSSGRKDVPRISFGNRLASANNLQSLVSASTSIRPLASNPRHKSTNSLYNMMRTMSDPPQLQPIERSVSDLEPILNRINTVAERVLLTQKQSVLEVLAASSGMALEASLDDLQSSSDDLFPQDMIENIQDKVARFLTSSSGLYINLLITFIYLANQYVVAPTSGEYAKLLGMTPAMSGVIIGMCPAAALLSSLVYSMWSNYSFKQPILTCIVCGVLGNLAYGMALQCDSAYLLILGRLLTGFGGPRVISRRYIADHVPQEKRLLASSQFVTAGALGLACGPLISSLVERAGFQFRWTTGALLGGDSSWTLLQYQAETAPGWIMAAMWLVSLLLVLLFFKEPEAQYMRASKMQRNGASNYQNLGALSTSRQAAQPRRSTFTNYNNAALDSAGPSSRNSNASLVSQKGDSRSMSPMNDMSGNINIFNWSQQGMLAAPSVKLHDFSSIEMGSALNNHSSSWYTGAASERSPLLNAHQAPAYAHYTYEDAPTPRVHCGAVSEAPRLWDCMTAEVLVILVIYTVNKTGQELVVSSIPLLTAGIFDWSHEAGGYYMAVVGAMVLPMVVLVNRMLVADVEERDMVLHLCYASLASIVLLLHTGLLGEYTLLQYIAGSVTLFASLNAMEGIIMALLAKVISPELAKGTFNSALLATETGTFGRVIGDVFITMFGVAAVPVLMVNQLFFPLAVMVVVSLGLVHWYFDRLM